MKKYFRFILIAIAFGCALAVDLPAQGYRFRYAFYIKGNPSDKGYIPNMDMNLDYISGKSYFYSDNTFQRDSLKKTCI